jgi:hypothetical protein
MSLYGLDIIVTKERVRFLNEINGIMSGMNGFREIYGDNRVEEQVWEMMQEKYGTLTVNDGTYTRKRFRRNHPFLYLVSMIISKIPPLLKYFLKKPVLSSSKAETAWLEDEAANLKLKQFPFETYVGQDSTVINMLNEVLPDPCVNPVIAEAITKNKFLQYLLMFDVPEVADRIVKSSLVGLGATNENELEEMLENGEHFVVKPILGICGKGVRVLTKDEVSDEYRYSRGPTEYVNFLEGLLKIKTSKIEYIEDLIKKKDFSFEQGVSIIQPFIDSLENNEYAVIRAIVCNGKFVDAYERRSLNPRVNLSQDARAVAFDYDDEFARFCEETVEVFERKASEYQTYSFQRELYQKYIDARGETSDDDRNFDKSSGIMGIIDAMVNMK